MNCVSGLKHVPKVSGGQKLKKSLAVLALASTIALAASAPAMAVDYPAPVPGTVSNATVTVGGSVVFSGGGFTPGETITVTITFTAAPQGAAAPGTSGGLALAVPGALHLAPTTVTAVANSSGAFSTNVTLTAAGTYQLTAVGATSGHSVTSTVVAAGVSGSGLANTGGTGLANTGGTGLANTGVDSSLILWGLVGAGALVAGTASVVVVRRRAKNEPVVTA